MIAFFARLGEESSDHGAFRVSVSASELRELFDVLTHGRSSNRSITSFGSSRSNRIGGSNRWPCELRYGLNGAKRLNGWNSWNVFMSGFSVVPEPPCRNFCRCGVFHREKI